MLILKGAGREFVKKDVSQRRSCLSGNPDDDKKLHMNIREDCSKEREQVPKP